MNIEQQIHARWLADGTLNGLLPAAKLVTGTRLSATEQPAKPRALATPDLPYASLMLTGGSPEMQSNCGTAVDRVGVRFVVYHNPDSYDECKAIAEAVKAAFNRADFSLSGSDEVLTMERGSDMPLQDDETKVWHWVLDFNARVFLNAGV